MAFTPLPFLQQKCLENQALSYEIGWNFADRYRLLDSRHTAATLTLAFSLGDSLAVLAAAVRLSSQWWFPSLPVGGCVFETSYD